MKVDKKELLHIANLANLNLGEEEIDSYLANLQDILNFANVLNSVDTSNVDETIGSTENVNVFRKDEINEFKDNEALLKNAPEKDNNMFSIPKVI